MQSRFLLLALLPCLPCSGQTTLKSAREILNLPIPKQSTTQEWTSGESAAPANTPRAIWLRDAKTLRFNSAKNTPAQNAEAWIALSSRRVAMPAVDTKTDQRRPNFTQLVQAIPDPVSWPEILKLARANYAKAPSQTNATNLYFAARLQNDEAAQTEALRRLYRILEPQFQKTIHNLPSPTKQMRTTNDYEEAQRTRESMQRFKSFAELLRDSPSPAQKKIGIDWQIRTAPYGNDYSNVTVPDLVSQVGEEAAKPLVRELLYSPIELAWYNAGKTRDLAKRIWLSDAKAQARPQWGLPESADDWKLAMAMLRKFPRAEANDFYEIASTRSVVLRGLLARGEFAQASQLVTAWLQPSSKITNTPNIDPVSSVYFPTIDDQESPALQMKKLEWVEGTLKAHPNLNWWGEYRALSLRLGETARSLKLLQGLVNQPSFGKRSIGTRHAQLEALSAAYLDNDDATRGGDTLVRALQLLLSAKRNGSDVQSDVDSLLRLTRIVPNAQWTNMARQGATAIFSSSQSSQVEPVTDDRIRLTLRLSEQNQRVFAQSLLVRAYQANIKALGKQQPWDFDEGYNSNRALLYGLMAIYKEANRPADMVYLLEHARGWGEKELTPILSYNTLSEWDVSPDDPETKTLPKLGYLAAWALAKTNRGAQASQILRALIEREGGYDSAYRLLCDIEGQKADAFLQSQAARDRFEERPLIWRAFLARRAGKLTQAQQLAQAAIATDPSDGEQGRGDRLRAYAELGAALRAQGKVAEAKKMETAVSAIRMAEDADYLRIAGLTARAIGLYKRSLSYFDDAYCVQSRLAVQLVGLGRYKEAAQHFRRAYELMPQSFGRLESHCFGCEGVFGGKTENGIARQVFLQLEKAHPNDPKVAYLSGYWRSTAGQSREAVRYFERAVALDPLYLSAWKQLSANQEFLSNAQRDRTTLKLIELDPRGIHEGYGGDVSYEMKRDYKGLWRTTQQVLPRKNPHLKANFKLTGSQNEYAGGTWAVWDLITHPSGAISSQSFVMKLGVVSL